jgi:hypothetical protein
LPPETVKPPHIGGGLEEVDVSFSSFLCAREKDIKRFWFFFKRNLKDVSLKKGTKKSFL